MLRINLLKTVLVLLIFFETAPFLQSQCMTYPVSLAEREVNSSHIVLGKVISQHSYWDAEQRNIHTLNIIEITAWLKGRANQTEIGLITLGGIVGDRAQISHPALAVQPWNEYVLFLQADNSVIDDRDIRLKQPGLIQAEPYADAQGAITKQFGQFHDLHSEPIHTEAALLRRIQDLTGEIPLTPEGRPFLARPGDTWPLSGWASTQAENQRGSAPITSFAPNPTNAGTIAASDFITINGSGFGAAAGTVFYSNADDGGATFTSSGVATDNLSWNDTQILNKPASNGGTGPINVNGVMTSGSNLNINYAHIDINSSFASFGATTRQAFHMVDKNGAGGYTYTYNTAFNTNTAAVEAFERALSTWRCATFVNFDVDKVTTTAISSTGNDGTNVIFFDATLPAGVLGRANSFFSGSATGACNLQNTVWWVNDIDIQFKPDPPAGCCSWNFGPAASGFLQFDFESVAVHELGHAHGLGHVIASGEVMHFSISNGADTRTVTPNEIAGGVAKVAFSTAALCFAPAGVNGPMTALNPATCLLPVEWDHFQGSHVPGKGNLLEWGLSHEMDNMGFEVQRSTDGLEFEAIDFVNSKGNSDVEVSYSYLDENPPAGVVFYRLYQTDLNGQTSFSETVRLDVLGLSQFEVFPTIVSNMLHIRGNLKNPGMVNFRIFSVSGQETLRKSFEGMGGNFDRSIRIEGLPAGIYFYQLSAASGQKTGKLIVPENQ